MKLEIGGSTEQKDVIIKIWLEKWEDIVEVWAETEKDSHVIMSFWPNGHYFRACSIPKDFGLAVDKYGRIEEKTGTIIYNVVKCNIVK